MKIRTATGIAAELGLEPGDDLRRINGEIVRDILDYRFHITDEHVLLEVDKKSGETVVLEVEKETDEDLGIEFLPLKVKSCGNKCVFCFVHQNPPNMRAPLYVMDEDYRLSFMHGNYITLTTIRKQVLDRIIRQGLSPLYISVHATDPGIRKHLFGIKRDDGLLEKLRRLADHNVGMHTQIVLCPGLNDGKILDQTLRDLTRFLPQLLSIAIVPVGLTKHRRDLPDLKPVDRDYANAFIDLILRKQADFRSRFGTSVVYLSDEFYICAGREVPELDYYEDFPQIENGVGMVRTFLNQFDLQQKAFPKRIPERRKISFATGTLAQPYLQRVVDRLNRIENLNVRLCAVPNHFYGETITVSGLLTAQDICNALLTEPSLGDLVLLPPNVLNHAGLFLDDQTLADVSSRLQTNTVLFSGSFSTDLGFEDHPPSARDTRLPETIHNWYEKSVTGLE